MAMLADPSSGSIVGGGALGVLLGWLPFLPPLSVCLSAPYLCLLPVEVSVGDARRCVWLGVFAYLLSFVSWWSVGETLGRITSSSSSPPISLPPS